jgi:uncharacterized membrane protein YgdD (TMEM256/DUF423 family)
LKLVKFALRSAALLGFTAVGIGAFGAHALKASLVASGKFDTFETAVRYHFYGAIVLLAMAGISQVIDSKHVAWPVYLYVAGTVLFSGSLYILCFAGISAMGMVAPVGGLCLMAAWLLLFWASFRK